MVEPHPRARSAAAIVRVIAAGASLGLGLLACTADVSHGGDGTGTGASTPVTSGSGGGSGPTGLGGSTGSAASGGATTTPTSSGGATTTPPGSGGASASGGARSTGGATGTGGASASGGARGSGGANAGGATAGSTLEAATQLCVDTINMYRATLGLAPYARWNAQESCTAGEALMDSVSGVAHSAFGMCMESAQDECPGWTGSLASIVTGCLAQMWAEGPGTDFATHGHYINMSNPRYTMASCGFATAANGRIWATQNFR